MRERTQMPPVKCLKLSKMRETKQLNMLHKGTQDSSGGI